MPYLLTGKDYIWGIGKVGKRCEGKNSIFSIEQKWCQNANKIG